MPIERLVRWRCDFCETVHDQAAAAAEVAPPEGWLPVGRALACPRHRLVVADRDLLAGTVEEAVRVLLDPLDLSPASKDRLFRGVLALFAREISGEVDRARRAGPDVAAS